MFPVQLAKPVVVIAGEGTGGSPRNARLVEFAAARVAPDGSETLRSWRFNPGVPLPEAVESRLRIASSNLRDLPGFAASAREIADFLAPCDLCGYDVFRKDLPLLCEELSRAGVKDFVPGARRILDLQRIFHRQEPRDLSAAVRAYCGHGHDGAHGAAADVRATLEVLQAMYGRHPGLPRDMDALDAAYGGRELIGPVRRHPSSAPAPDLGSLLSPEPPAPRGPAPAAPAFPVRLSRPLVAFDIEGTGLDLRSDRIIELAATRVEPDGSRVSRRWLMNPAIPIPPESTAIHGYSGADVCGLPTFQGLALEIFDFFFPCDLCGFNLGHYDIPILHEEFKRAGIDFSADDRLVLDVQRIFHAFAPRDLPAAVRFFCPPGHPPAEGAEESVRAILDVLAGQCARYPGLPGTFAGLAREFDRRDRANADLSGRLRWADGEIVLNFGRKRGTPLRVLREKDPGFLKWIVKGDFPFDTRAIAENALNGVFPEPPR